MGVYRLELASTGRAACSNTECKKNGIKIGKGELRFGSQYTFKETTAMKWKHWGCVTPKQISNIEETIEGNLDFLDGYDEIDEDSQAKVRKALEDGHVADDEWKGDIEMNRTGANGFRSPATKKAKKEAKKAEEAAADGAASPSKLAPKKRSRTKGNDDDEAPTSKKVKSASKKNRKTREDGNVESVVNSVASENDVPSESASKVKKASTLRKREPVVKEIGEEMSTNDYANGHGRPGKRGPPRKAKNQAHAIDEDSDTQIIVESAGESLKKPVKIGKGRKKKSAT